MDISDLMPKRQEIRLTIDSPVVAITSKPTKPKKQVAAPSMIPSKPKGTKPPVPQSSVAPGSDEVTLHTPATSSSGMLQ